MQKSSLKYEVTKYNNTFKTIIYHSQGGFIPGIARVIQYLQNNVLHHINKRMDRIHMTDSFQKLQHSLVKKNPQQSRFRGDIPQHNKDQYKKPTAAIYLNWENMTAFPITPGTGQGYLLYPLLFSIVLKVLVRPIKFKKKEMKLFHK